MSTLSSVDLAAAAIDASRDRQHRVVLADAALREHVKEQHATIRRCHSCGDPCGAWWCSESCRRADEGTAA